ncbi:hypothetical protein Dpoa2040_001263 [Dickeya sp. CFBP 2040]|uniref:hypothetical protein n=1 Tax=Dickeya sp. CFBP 2040 TaxID=2718531 RepID=UPI001448A2CF|nr:hypothetical protein [Dickeya sp. CFBP 2040]NKI74032.1 hypothetical protein [Dickeya sp. CFBP 2040]
MKISNKELEEAKAKLHEALNGPIYNHWCYRPYVQLILAALDSAESELATVRQAQQEPVAFRWRQLADGEFPASKWEYLPADRAEYFIEQVGRNDRGVEYGYVYAAPPAPFPPSGLSVINPDEWTPCSPEYLKSRRHACSEAPRVWCEKEKNHYHPKNWPTDKPSPVVPDGWRLVPIEPTESMLIALHRDVIIEAIPSKKETNILNEKAVWASMLAAAPHPDHSRDTTI